MGLCASFPFEKPQPHIIEQQQAVADVVKRIKAGAEEVTCSRRNLRNQGTIDVAKKLGTSRLRSLRLRSNEIGDAGVKVLAMTLPECRFLLILDLGFNCIGGNGASYLAMALEENTTLTSLSLTNNKLGDVGASRLADALSKNTQLLDLFIEDNRITSRGAASLGRGLANNDALQVLWIIDNPIGPDGIISFAKAMDGGHSSLKKFGFTMDTYQMTPILAGIAHLHPKNIVRQAIKPMTRTEDEDLPNDLYHEKQRGSLCAMHCLNNLLQGPIFSDWQLTEIASCLDLEEGRLVLGAAIDDGGNAGDDGFNVQVIISALRGIGCDIDLLQVNNSHEVLEQFERLQGLICNQNKHWFAVRRIYDEWFDLNSLLDAPIRIKEVELVEYLNDAIVGEQDVFLVRGQLREWEKVVEVRL